MALCEKISLTCLSGIMHGERRKEIPFLFLETEISCQKPEMRELAIFPLFPKCIYPHLLINPMEAEPVFKKLQLVSL